MKNKFKNKVKLEIEACNEKHIAYSNEVEAEKINIRVIEYQDKECCFEGDTITYTTKICNDSDVILYNSLFEDEIPHGLCYIPNSFYVNNIAKTPVFEGNKLKFCIPTISKYSETIITFCVRVY